MMTSTPSDAIDRLELSSRRMNMNTPLVIEEKYHLAILKPLRLNSWCFDCPQTRTPHVLGRPPICFAYLNPRRHILHLRRNTLLPDLQSSDAAAFKFLATPPPSTPNRRNLTLPAIVMNTPDALPLPAPTAKPPNPPSPTPSSAAPNTTPPLTAAAPASARTGNRTKRTAPTRSPKVSLPSRPAQRRPRQPQQADARPARCAGHASGLRPRRRQQNTPHARERRAIRAPHVDGVVRAASLSARNDDAHGGGCGADFNEGRRSDICRSVRTGVGSVWSRGRLIGRGMRMLSRGI